MEHPTSLPESLEAVQNPEARSICSDYPRFTSVTNLKHHGEIQPLALRRRRSKLCLPHKIYYTTSLNSSLLLPPSYTSARRDNFCKLRISNCKSSFLSSVLPSAILDWNSLPDNVVCLSDPIEFQAAIDMCTLLFEPCKRLYVPCHPPPLYLR